MSDLSLWQSADQRARQQIANSEEPSAFADCLRYALQYTSINSIADNYPSSLLLDALRLKLWTFERVMNIAAHISRPYNRVALYAELLGLTFLSDAERAEVREVALAVAINVEFPWPRFWTLMLIIPHVHDEQKAQAVAVALAGIHALDPKERYFPNIKFEDYGVYNMSQEQAVIDAFAALASHLNHAEVQQAMTISAETIDFEIYQAQALINLLPAMSSDQIFSTIDAALAIDDNRFRAESLVQIIPHLKSEHFQHVLEGTLRIRDPQQRIHVLVTLLPILTGLQSQIALGEAVEAIHPIHPSQHRDLVYGILQPQARTAAITELAPFLTSLQGEHVLTLALETSDEEGLAPALAALVPRLQNTDSLERILGHVSTWKNEASRFRVLLAFAAVPQTALMQRLLDAALTLQHEERRVNALAALSPHLSADQQWMSLHAVVNTTSNHAWTALHKMRTYLQPEHIQFLVDLAVANLATPSNMVRLFAVAEFLQPAQVDRLIAVARSTDDLQMRSLTLDLASPHLSPEQLPLAFELLQTILANGSNHDKINALKALAPRLSRGQRQQLLDACLSRDDLFELHTMLEVLIPSLDDAQKGYLIGVAQTAAGKRQTALISLLFQVGKLNKEQVDTVLDTILAMPDLDVIEELLAKISPEPTLQQQERVRMTLLPRFQEKTQRALAAAIQVDDVKEVARALAALAPHLAGEGLQKALHAALQLPHNDDGADALEVIAPRVPDDQIETVFTEVLSRSQSDLYRGRVLARMANRLHGDQIQRVLDALESFTTYQEYVLLPLAGKLQGEQIQQALELALTIRDQFQVATQAVARNVTTAEQAGRLLERAINLRQHNELAFTHIIEAVAPRLSLRQAKQVLDLASTLKNEERRSESLAALAPRLDQPDRTHAITRALDAAWEIRRGEYRANVIRTLAPHLADKQLQNALKAALDIHSGLPQHRAKAFAGLFPYLTAGQQQNVLETWLTDVERTDFWLRSSLFKEIAPHVSGVYLERLLQAAASIPKTSTFVYAFQALQPYLSAAQQSQMIADRLSDLWPQAPSPERIEALVSMLSLVPDKAPLLKEIWSFMLDRLQNLKTDTRQAILKFVRDRNLFFPSAYSPDLLEQVVSAIIDVCLVGR